MNLSISNKRGPLNSMNTSLSSLLLFIHFLYCIISMSPIWNGFRIVNFLMFAFVMTHERSDLNVITLWLSAISPGLCADASDFVLTLPLIQSAISSTVLTHH